MYYSAHMLKLTQERFIFLSSLGSMSSGSSTKTNFLGNECMRQKISQSCPFSFFRKSAFFASCCTMHNADFNDLRRNWAPRWGLKQDIVAQTGQSGLGRQMSANYFGCWICHLWWKQQLKQGGEEEMSFIFGCHQWLSSSLTNISNSSEASFPVPTLHHQWLLKREKRYKRNYSYLPWPWA